jgi:cytidine deaminase
MKINLELIKKACQVRNNAQARYSNYHVGSAVTNNLDQIFQGCNVERVSYSQTTHAEQNAIDSMIANQGPCKIKEIAVAAGHKNIVLSEADIKKAEIIFHAPPCSCCGHCLQIIWENCFNDKDVPIYFIGASKTIYVTTIGQLLPYPFGPMDIGVDYQQK